jgi:hypothetical protein
VLAAALLERVLARRPQTSLAFSGVVSHRHCHCSVRRSVAELRRVGLY